MVCLTSTINNSTINYIKEKPMDLWTLVYWAEEDKKPQVEEWLNNLKKDQLKCVSKELLLLETCGNNLRLPHSKPLDDGLFELREMSFGYRIYYCFSKGKVIVLLIAGDKSSQKKDIKIAKERLLKWKRGEIKNENKKLSKLP
jgi:putative addiction module killer protein